MTTTAEMDCIQRASWAEAPGRSSQYVIRDGEGKTQFVIRGPAKAEKQYEIRGTVAPGFEPVRAIFEQHFQDDAEDKAQVCAYVRGVKVVDLWGERKGESGKGDSTYGFDGLQNICSSGKSLTALVVAMLADRGHLKYDQKVSTIWPEFGDGQKGSITVADVMRHEAGLYSFSNSLPVSDLTSKRIMAGAVSDIIASQQPAHKPGARRHYH